MKNLLGPLLVAVLCWGAAQAQPSHLLYRAIPDPSYQLVRVGSHTVIQDARGFFVGYYKPLPPPQPTVVKTAPSKRTSGLWVPKSALPSSVYADTVDGDYADADPGCAPGGSSESWS